MHFTGRTWRPPYEESSLIIQATTGCTYNKCRFCNLYKEECFRMSPMKEFEKDLEELKFYQPNARRIFWTGANPFSMSYENLKLRALTVSDYLIKCQTIAMFASIRDIKSKTIEQLRKLRAMGINGLSIGIETGDDTTLTLANKGYTTEDIIEQCRKLDEAGIEYYFVYMTGKGSFIPAGEKERIEELQVLIRNLQIRTHLFANTVSNFIPVSGYLPRDREQILMELQHVIDNTPETEMAIYRENLKSLG